MRGHEHLTRARLPDSAPPRPRRHAGTPGRLRPDPLPRLLSPRGPVTSAVGPRSTHNMDPRSCIVHASPAARCGVLRSAPPRLPANTPHAPRGRSKRSIRGRLQLCSLRGGQTRLVHRCRTSDNPPVCSLSASMLSRLFVMTQLAQRPRPRGTRSCCCIRSPAEHRVRDPSAAATLQALPCPASEIPSPPPVTHSSRCQAGTPPRQSKHQVILLCP